jgi:hypothetical protein
MFDSVGLKRQWPNALLFVLVAAGLLYLQWMIDARHVLHELGDHAANSLLVLDAKRLHLLYGNYSRIGVHHPGPAIMYVLAAGEWLFHDVLRIAPSPYSGQLLAICLYSAAWIVLIFSLMRRTLGAVLPALLFTTVFTAVLGYLHSSVFLGSWFPDLYILPFAAMLVAIARLAHGETDQLRALAVASGFLINGHVSFIPMLGVILIVMLAANLLIARQMPERRILSPRFLQRHRRDILVAVGILFLFFVPLLILSVTEFPGPVRYYVKFGGSDKHNTLAEAFGFVAVYWSGTAGFVTGLILACLGVLGVRGTTAGFARDVRSLALTFLAASAALLVYAKFGIDHLDLVYLGLFYYSVPALMTGLVVLYAWQALRWNGKAALAALVSVAALAGTWQAASEPPYYNEMYEIKGSAQLFERLTGLPGTGRIVLDIEQKPGDWDKVWGNVAALELYAKRRGQDVFCINENWHILFTQQNRCRPEELDNPRRFFVRYMNTPDLVRGDADIEGQGLLLYRHGRADQPGAYTMLADHMAYFTSILGKGWGNLEGEFVWSVGPVAEIKLPADPKRTSPLRLDLSYFRPERKSGQELAVFVNGKPVGQWSFYPIEQRRQIPVDLGPDPTAAQHIELKIAHPVSPLQLGISQDYRQLGVSLYGIK